MIEKFVIKCPWILDIEQYLNDFNFTRYIMNKNNITDAQYETISQGPDHVKFTISSWIVSHNYES